MDSDLSGFFATSAQVIPTLLVVVAIETGVLRWLVERSRIVDARSAERFFIRHEAHLGRFHNVDAAEDLMGSRRFRFWRRFMAGNIALGVLLAVASEALSLVSLAFPPTGSWRTVAVVIVLAGLAVLLIGTTSAVIGIVGTGHKRRRFSAELNQRLTTGDPRAPSAQ